jgi:hypothetical protein
VASKKIHSIPGGTDTVKYKQIQSRAAIAAVSLLLANQVHAFDMGNMMNPSKWMGNNNDDDEYYDDYYGGPGYGYGGPGYGPGYGYGGPGYGGPGYGYGDPGYGYGGPGYGYGGPGYGGDPAYGGAPAYGVTPGYGSAPGYSAQGAEPREAEIRRLKERLRQLEGGVQ